MRPHPHLDTSQKAIVAGLRAAVVEFSIPAVLR